MNDLIKINKSRLPLTGSSSYDSALRKINAEAEITPEGLARYFRELRDRGLAVATINHKIAAVKKSLKIAAERMGEDSWRARYELERIFERNDMKRIKVDTSIRDEDCLTRAELNRVIEVANNKTALLIRALYETACRISELCNIRLIDCDRAKRGVTINIIGKGKKAGSVFMTLKLFREIQVAWSGDTYLFQVRTGRPLSRYQAWEMIKRAGMRAGVDKIHPHTIRHTWATLNLPRLGIHKVSLYLRHVEISTTSKFYLHNKPKMGEILQGRLW